MPSYTRRRVIAAGIGAAGLGALAGCTSNGDGGSAGSADTSAEASFFIFGDWASQIAGDTAAAESLVPVGQHGHGWEPGPQIRTEVQEADLFVRGKEGFQPWADDMVSSLRSDDADVTVVSAGASVSLADSTHSSGDENGHEGEHGHDEESHSEDEHGGETPWEWAGLYHLDAGSYTYTFHEGPDPRMQLAIVPTDEGGDHGLHHAEETGKALYGNHDTHTPAEGGTTLTPASDTLYHLRLADSGETRFTLDIASEGHYVLFAQHVPSEFDATLVNGSGSTVEPELTETAGGHNHDGESGHDEEGSHGHEDGHDGEDGHDHESEHDHEGESEHDEEDSHDHEEGHEEESGHGHGHDHGGKDPHFWMDPMLAKTAVGTIEDGFASIDGDNEDTYTDNADGYRSRLDELDEQFQSTLANASKDVVFVAGHNAYQYLGKRYGFEVRTLTDLSPDDRPTPQDIERAQNIIAEHDLEYVCADPLESQRAANRLVEETDATEVLPLTAIPGQTQEWADNDWGYVDVMEKVNLETLQRALDAE